MPTGSGLMLCDDLIFFSRVAATAQAAGLVVRQARSIPALLALARQHTPGGVILDLHTEGLDLQSFLTELRAACPLMPRVIGYGSHVDVERLRTARAAGCDQVLPRSQFVQNLERELPRWLCAEGSDHDAARAGT